MVELAVSNALALRLMIFFRTADGGTPSVLVAEVLLGTKRATVGTSARGFDFGSGADRLCLKAVVVMSMPVDHDVRPCKWRLIGKSGGLWSSNDPSLITLPKARSREI